MSVTKPITFRCTADIAAQLGASSVMPIAVSVRPLIIIETEQGLMFWRLLMGALSNSLGDPNNRRKGAPI